MLKADREAITTSIGDLTTNAGAWRRNVDVNARGAHIIWMEVFNGL